MDTGLVHCRTWLLMLERAALSFSPSLFLYTLPLYALCALWSRCLLSPLKLLIVDFDVTSEHFTLRGCCGDAENVLRRGTPR